MALSVYRDAKKGHDMQFVVRPRMLWLIRCPKNDIGNSSSEKEGSSTLADRKEDYQSGSLSSEEGT